MTAPIRSCPRCSTPLPPEARYCLACGAATLPATGHNGQLAVPAASGLAEPAAHELARALADRYAILRELGHGGMATVYLADDLRHHRQVAVKVLHSDLAAASGSERFLREIEIAAQLTHPHILPMHESGEAGGLLYYVMPLVEGESLRERLAREGELPVRDAVQILHEIADALAYAHQHGVIHRDIKPDNVMLTSRHALVMDFGVAKAVSAATGVRTLTTAGLSIGTPTYMAPEQATADPHVDHRADIYALGVLGYEMLTGRAPFAAATPQAILAAQVTEEPEPLARLRHGVPRALAQIIMKCLRKKPADRWQTAEEVLRQLEALTTPSDTAPVAPAVPGRGWPLGRRPAVGVAAAVGIVGVAAVAALLLSRNGDGDTGAASRVVVTRFENQTADAELDALGAMAADWVTQGLTEAPFLTVLDTRSPLAAARAGGVAAGPVAVGRETGAGVVVAGSYFLQGDSLRFQARISSTADGNILLGIGGVTAPRDRPLDGVEQLRQRVLAAFASLHNRDVSTFQTALAQPPTYAAYREYVEGLDLYMGGGEYREAARHFEQAAALDSTFLTALVWAAQSGMLARLYGDEALARRADSLISGLKLLRHRLSPFDGARLDFVVALRDRNRLEAYRAALRLVDASPGSVDARREAAISALRVLRPREALRRLGELDPERGLMREWTGYWSAAAWAHHLLGQHEDELKAVRRGRQLHPSAQTLPYLELRALAALGRTMEIDSLARAQLPASPGQTGLIAFGIAGELMAHGHAESAYRLARYAAGLPGAPPPSQQAAQKWLDQHVDLRRQVGDPQCYFYLGEPVETYSLAERARDESLHWRAELALLVGDAEMAATHAAQLRDPDAHGLLLARILAAQSKQDAARAALELKERRALQTRGTLRGLEIERAGALVRLGDLERGLETMSEGLGRGAIDNSTWGQDGHAHPDLAPLWSDPRFQALIKPRG